MTMKNTIKRRNTIGGVKSSSDTILTSQLDSTLNSLQCFFNWPDFCQQNMPDTDLMLTFIVGVIYGRISYR